MLGIGSIHVPDTPVKHNFLFPLKVVVLSLVVIKLHVSIHVSITKLLNCKMPNKVLFSKITTSLIQTLTHIYYQVLKITDTALTH